LVLLALSLHREVTVEQVRRVVLVQIMVEVVQVLVDRVVVEEEVAQQEVGGLYFSCIRHLQMRELLLQRQVLQGQVVQVVQDREVLTLQVPRDLTAPRGTRELQFNSLYKIYDLQTLCYGSR
jgi:hypothetical protein